MERLSRLILAEMKKKNQSCLQFSELCGVGRNIVEDIINQKKKDVKLSTIVNICKNSDIQICDIFCTESDKKSFKYLLNGAYVFNRTKKTFLNMKRIKQKTADF